MLRIKIPAVFLVPALLAGVISVFFVGVSCRLYNLEKRLDPESAEFLAKVRYIITREERKIFLELPDTEKPQFVEEFWKRRDPDPDTQENEFKTEYFGRIDKATELFRGEGRPGWLTDRGRIFVLFGPPTDRITHPMGGDSYRGCQEIWYYGNFPIVFVDANCAGHYILTTLDLAHLHEMNLAQAFAQKTFQKEKEFFDFDFSRKKTAESGEALEGLFLIETPYEGIWFGVLEGSLATTLEVRVELRDAANALVWEYKGEYEIRMSEAELKESRKRKYRIEVPYTLRVNQEEVRRGKSKVHVSIKNRTGGEEVKKVFDFGLRP